MPLFSTNYLTQKKWINWLKYPKLLLAGTMGSNSHVCNSNYHLKINFKMLWVYCIDEVKAFILLKGECQGFSL